MEDQKNVYTEETIDLDAEEKKTGLAIKIDWKKAVKTAGNIACGVCAVIGVMGLGSYGWDKLHRPKTQVPKVTPDDVQDDAI